MQEDPLITAVALEQLESMVDTTFIAMINDMDTKLTLLQIGCYWILPY